MASCARSCWRRFALLRGCEWTAWSRLLANGSGRLRGAARRTPLAGWEDFGFRYSCFFRISLFGFRIWISDMTQVSPHVRRTLAAALAGAALCLIAVSSARAASPALGGIAPRGGQ